MYSGPGREASLEIRLQTLRDRPRELQVWVADNDDDNIVSWEHVLAVYQGA